MAKPLFVAIGVHKAKSMPVLDGVLTSIENLSNWAVSHGHDLLRIDDRLTKVTVDQIKQTLTPIDPATGEPDPKRLLDRPRIVIYFCGHGLHAPQDQYWILSAGPNQPNERISAVGFRDVLATYGPKQIAIFSDACRSAQVVQGLASSVVDANDALPGIIQKDNFFSSQDGQASFAVPSIGGKQAYCIFSSVLLTALSEPVPEAFDPLYLQTKRYVVSSQSLASYLEQKVPDAALNVAKLQVPQCDPGFRPVINSYAEFDGAAIKTHLPKRFPAKPNIASLTKRSAADRAAAQSARIRDSRSEWRGPYVQRLQSIMGRALENHIRRRLWGPLMLLSNKDYSEIAIALDGKSQYPTNFVKVPDDNLGRSNLMVVPNRGFVDSGKSSIAVASAADIFALIPLHKNLWCAAIIDKWPDDDSRSSGVELLAWGGVYPSRSKFSAAEALKGLSARTLNSEDTAILATEMRHQKHVDPMYGIVSAYLYNGIGDVGNIRRMCYYYRSNGQDVPFDIAMLARLEFKGRPDGGFYVQVPKVEETPKAERHKNAPSWVWEKTPAVKVEVTGVTPLLRAGWQHIEASRHKVHRKFWELTPHLTDSPISTFQGHETGARLIDILRKL